MFRPILALLLSLACATLSPAAETYVGDARTDFGTVKRPGQFELKVSGSKIAGRIFSPVLSHRFRVHGSINRDGKFSLRATNPAVKGRITGTIHSGRLRGKGRLTSAGKVSAVVKLQSGPRLLTSAYNWGDLSGKYVCVPDNWDRALYSWAQVTVTPNDKGGFDYDIILAGKEGDRWDEVKGTGTKGTDGGTIVRQVTGDNAFDYPVLHRVIPDEVSHIKVDFSVTDLLIWNAEEKQYHLYRQALVRVQASRTAFGSLPALTDYEMLIEVPRPPDSIR